MSCNISIYLFSFTIGIFASCVEAYIYRKIPIMWSICLAWQPIIFMNLYEALVWKELRDNEGSKIGIYTSVFTSLLQPILMGLLLMVRNGISSINRFTATVLIIVHIYRYSYVILSMDINNMSIDAGLYPNLIYCFTVINLFLLLVPYKDIAFILILATIMNHFCSYSEYVCGGYDTGVWNIFFSMIPSLIGIYWEKLYGKV